MAPEGNHFKEFEIQVRVLVTILSDFVCVPIKSRSESVIE